MGDRMASYREHWFKIKNTAKDLRYVLCKSKT